MSVSISLCTDDGDDCTVMTCTALSIHVQVVLTVVSETQEEEEEKPSEDRKRTGGEGEKELEGKGKKNWRGRGCHCQSVLQFSTRLRRDGLETENSLEGKRCVTVSQFSSWEEMAWRQKHVWRGRGVSLSVSAAARQLRRGGFWGVCKGLLRAYFSQSLLESLPLLRCRIGEGAEAKTIWADD